MFKTPGKLRGKTPRTARKRDVLGSRQPLTDIFGPNAQAAPPTARKNTFLEKVAHFQIAEDAESEQVRPSSRSKSPQRVGKPGNTDSGYHGMTEDEMDLDGRTEVATQSTQQSFGAVQLVPLRENQEPAQRLLRLEGLEGGRNSDESFLSAKEDLSTSQIASREAAREGDVESDQATVPDDEEMAVDPEQVEDERVVEETPAAVTRDVEMDMMDQDVDEEASHSPSDASSPAKTLQRKSSFTFSALPAREPLTAKRSMGGCASQFEANRNSVLARSYGTKAEDVAVEDGDDDEYEQRKPEEALEHSKSSTQRLHERITMLGKTNEPRQSKSIPHSVLTGQTTYPELPPVANDEEVVPDLPKADADVLDDDEDDDWIAPSKTSQGAQRVSLEPPQQQLPLPKAGSPTRQFQHQKSISTTFMPSPTRPTMAPSHQKAQSVSNPSLAHVAGIVSSTTPMGSPVAAKKHHDGPLSASKNKLWSALKSAKNIFASSASASAAAKMEAHSGSPFHHRKLESTAEAAVFTMPGALYSDQQISQSPSRTQSVVSKSPSRKTRSSNESRKKLEKEMKAAQKASDELEKVREKERVKAAKQLEEKRKADEIEAAKQQKEQERLQAERPTSAGSDSVVPEMQPPPVPPKSMLPSGKLRAPGRLMRPTREQPTAPVRPVPVSIRVASQSQRLGQGGAAAQSNLSKSQHESMAPPPPPKTASRAAPAAQANVRSSVVPPPNNARVKALEAAARKKEADEKAAAKKAEQKREMDRKRALKAEEERRAEEERKVLEQQRIQDAKMIAQRKANEQAAEARRREMMRLEQQRAQEEAQRARSAHELAEAIKRERAMHPPAQRADVVGTLRQLGKNTVNEAPQPPPRAVQVNGAKPAKRAFQDESEERPAMQRAAPSYQQTDAKRRRTNEREDGEREERHSVMAPPKRPSNMRKVSSLINPGPSTLLTRPQESTLAKFPHGYTHAPPPANHHAPTSIFKATVTAQHQMQHASNKPIPSHPSQTVQLSNARIPFAENNNPPASSHNPYQTHPGHENAHPNGPNKFKTPGRPAAHGPNKSAAPSPSYPNGETIQLPEIQSDSEDEDSEGEDGATGFRAPSWVASPALRDLLTQQQLVDPETIFGPIAELKMEEVFKGGKNAERLKRFRDRTSSAQWVESGDQVTSAEKRKDMMMRERVVRDGGWRYEPSA